MLFLSFLVFPVARRFRHRIMWWDWLAALLSIAVIVYALHGRRRFHRPQHHRPTRWDIVFGVALIAAGAGGDAPHHRLDHAGRHRRASSLYALFGAYLPAPWTHKGYEVGRLVGRCT